MNQPVPRATACAAALVLACSSSLAMIGVVVDERGEAVPTVRVCYIAGNVEQLCAETDAKGSFELPDTRVQTMRFMAKDHVPRTLDVAKVEFPFVLQRTPTLLVRLVDDTSGARIGDGRIWVFLPSGAKKGPFPVNQAGVKVRRVLEPGPIRIQAEAEGYVPDKAVELTLEAGKLSEVVIRLARAS